MSKVLLVGEDELLQQTRAAVLRTTGVENICTPPRSALAIQQDRQCDLVILCHSLPDQLCAVLADNIHIRWPKTRILLVTPTRMWESPHFEIAVDAVSSADPVRLIRRATELLKQPDAPSRKPANRSEPAFPQSSAKCLIQNRMQTNSGKNTANSVVKPPTSPVFP